jgi:hypothetical protein
LPEIGLANVRLHPGPHNSLEVEQPTSRDAPKPPSNACALRCGSRLTTPMQCSTSLYCGNEKINTRGGYRLLAPLSRQRLPIGMGCTSAPIIEVLRDAGPFDLCLTDSRNVAQHRTRRGLRLRFRARGSWSSLLSGSATWLIRGTITNWRAKRHPSGFGNEAFNRHFIFPKAASSVRHRAECRYTPTHYRLLFIACPAA